MADTNMPGIVNPPPPTPGSWMMELVPAFQSDPPWGHRADSPKHVPRHSASASAESAPGQWPTLGLARLGGPLDPTGWVNIGNQAMTHNCKVPHQGKNSWVEKATAHPEGAKVYLMVTAVCRC